MQANPSYDLRQPGQSYEAIPPNSSYDPLQTSQHFDSIQPSQHFDSIQPSQHFDSMQPSQPYDSMQPSQPYEAIQPSQPYDSMQPSQHFESIQPSQPYESIQPSQPYDSMQPSQPFDPLQPGQPFDPLAPSPMFDALPPSQPFDPRQPPPDSPARFHADAFRGDYSFPPFPTLPPRGERQLRAPIDFWWGFSPPVRRTLGLRRWVMEGFTREVPLSELVDFLYGIHILYAEFARQRAGYSAVVFGISEWSDATIAKYLSQNPVNGRLVRLQGPSQRVDM